jgi:hypothetical protein
MPLDYNTFTSAGTEIHIGAAMPGTYDKAGFEAVNWTEIGEVTDIPEFGRVFELVTSNPLSSRRTRKKKGSWNDGSLTIQYDWDDTDDGQEALEDAEGSDDLFPFKVVLQSGRHIYFAALVMGKPINIGTINNMTAGSSTLELEGDILFEDAPASA